MRRGLALSIATAAWIVVVQLLSGAVAPARVYELDPADVDQMSSEATAATPENLAGDGASRDHVIGGGNRPILGGNGPTVPGAPTSTTPPTTASSTTTVAPTTTAPTSTAPPTTVPPTTAPPATGSSTTGPSSTAPPTTTTSTGGGFSASAETDFATRINALRSSVGAAPLAGNADLNNYARWWAREMAVSGNFAHSDIGSLLGPWSIVGENIGYGPAVETVFQALVNSSGHYNNMVDTRFTSVGVGVFVDTSGRIWTAHVFAG